jgi:hypothetical protein
MASVISTEATGTDVARLVPEDDDDGEVSVK